MTRDWFLSELQKEGLVNGFTWLISPEPQPQPLPSTIEDILLDPDVLHAENPAQVTSENMVVSQEQIKQVATLTAGQRNNVHWGLYRKGRITASNFGGVLKVVQRLHSTSWRRSWENTM